MELTMADALLSGNFDVGVQFAFQSDTVKIDISSIFPLKLLREGVRGSKKFAQILGSIRSVGLVEAPVVIADKAGPGRYFLLDGHLRVEALKELGVTVVNCLIATDDEAYTYNKRVSRLPPLQEHRMITLAVERGVEPEVIAAALGLEVISVHRRFKMLDGICPEAIELLKETSCPMNVFDILRQMSPLRQIESSDLMVGQNNFSLMFARALLAATPEEQLSKTFRRRRKTEPNLPAVGQLARMERELAALQMQVKTVEEGYGINNLHLTVARGYISKLLANPRISKWLSQRREEYVIEFERIAQIESISGALEAPN
jgi:RepB plasmid partitioning protein/ParB-like nuclease domain